MKEHFLLVAAAATLLLPGGPAHANSVVIEHVTLIDGTHAAQADMNVAVEGERIATVTPTALAHDLKGRRIDARGKYLIPGLMDVHIHLRGGSPVTLPDWPHDNLNATVEMNVSFVQPATGAARITATARAFHRSHTMVFCDADVHDAEMRLIAKALGTFKYRNADETKESNDPAAR